MTSRLATCIAFVFLAGLAPACTDATSDALKGSAAAEPGDAADSKGDARPGPDGSPPDALVAARPYGLAVPDSYDPAEPAPLVVLMHGYGINGTVQAWYFRLIVNNHTPDAAPPASSSLNRLGFLLAYPDGTLDSDNKRFWNGTDACCNFYDSGVDDVAYIMALIDDVSKHYSVDAKRIYLVGHSNGSFLAHRIACEHAERFAAILTLNGAQWGDSTRCNPSEPVDVLVVHGDADPTNPYDGGGVVPANNRSYPSPAETVATWGAKNGCTGALVDGPSKDLDSTLDGDETRTQTMSGCPEGGGVEFWTIGGGIHIPPLSDHWPDDMWSYLSAHAKR